MRKLIAFVTLGAAIAVFSSLAFARTEPLVTGGATNLVPGLNLTVNGLHDTRTDEFKGKINYDYAPAVGTAQHFLFRVDCVGVDPAQDVAVAVGPERDNPNMWGVVWIEDNEGGTDQASIHFQNQATALANCANPQDLAAVPVTDGNFQVRPPSQ